MRISYSFYYTEDLSDLSNGERLLEILSSYGFVINKAGDCEPIREVFDTSKLPEMWRGVGMDGLLTCYFLFKGQKEVSFSGMVTWNVNLHPDTRAFNGVSLWFNIPKSYDVNKLLRLGDDIFKWSGSVYGYITENSKDQTTERTGNPHDGLPGLMWVNYFGPAYITQPDFHTPNDYVSIGHGARIILSETPQDERLADLSFLDSIKSQIGFEWFWHFPRKYKKRVPVFDKSEITRRGTDA